MTFPPPSPRQARVIWLALTGLAIAVLAGLTVGLVWGLGRVLQILAPVLWPLAVAGVVAYLLDPLVDLLERRGMKRPRAIIAVFALAVLLVAAIFGSIVPQLVNETRQLASQFPAYAQRTGQRLEQWLNNPPPLIKRLIERTNPPQENSRVLSTNEVEAIAGTNAFGVQSATTNALPAPRSTLSPETLQTAAQWGAKALPKIGSWLFGQVGRVASWFGVLAGLVLLPVYTFYFLLEKKGISSRWTDYLPVADSRFKNELVFVLNSINNYLITFFRGQVLVALCDGILYGTGFVIVGLPYAALIGVMAVFLTMIPFLGAIVTCLTALVIALVQFGDLLHPLLVLAVFGCVQALEGLIISPKIMGGRVGLHPVTIIIAVMAGTTLLGGILGGILAIPLTAALRVVMFRYIWKRRTAE
ncbi:MAG TPA: AI-2E family transporter [Verrucomicrobiae bacterium]